MKAIIMPSIAAGTVQAPPSKSMAHRVLLGAGLSEGTTTVKNIAFSEDINATMDLLEALGAVVSVKENVVVINGIGTISQKNKLELNCRESGSTLRFFIPVVLCLGGAYQFRGAKRLLERPLDIYEKICLEQHIIFEKAVASLTVEGKLGPGEYVVPGDVSSQFITGLLYALPLLDGDSKLEILPPVESKPYIDMTLEVLKTFGIQIRVDGNCYYISGNQKYNATDVEIEGDYSNAAFLEAFNLISGNVTVKGLSEDSLQGDKVYQEYFRALQEGTPTLDISLCPDLGPILMGMASCLNGAILTGTKRLAIKESNRGVAMAEELSKFGICCDVKENEIFIHKGELYMPKVRTNGHNDHRIVMTLALLHSKVGGVIDGCEAVKKSFPDFFEKISTLGIHTVVE